jgi:outer membrane receptor protein involved in Fe transport
MSNVTTARLPRWSVAFAVASALCIAAASRAQTAPTSSESAEGSGEELQQVTVTGSRIRRPEYEGTIPGAQTNREEIETRSFGNVQDILNDIPLVGAGASLNGNNGGQPSSLGASFIDLLDLGTARTLTLVNGRRFVSGNAGSLFVAGNETGGQVDVNNIPVDLIDRIDVLTVGGAAAYGSDAISGVVNYVLKDDFDGFRLTGRYGQTAESDGVERAIRGLWGTNFADNRGNVYVSAEFSKIDGIQADERDFRVTNPGGLTNYLNGGRRNPNFTPGLINVAGSNNGAFLRAADDGVPGTVFQPALTTTQLWPSGVIFNQTAGPTTPTNQISPLIGGTPVTFFSGVTQLIPGLPGASPAGATGNPIVTFAPTALPTGVTAAQVFTAFGVPSSAFSTLTAAQQTTLAINVLQANRPTPRDYFAANPNTPVNAFIGSFIPAFPDVANTGASAAFLPRIAVPLRFNAAGAIETWNPATLFPDTPSTAGGAVGGQGFNPIFNTVLRVDQERRIASLGGSFEITDNLQYFTRSQFSDIEASSRRNGASANSSASGTVENAALLMNTSNPFLTADNRAALAAAGIGANTNFVLSRTNQDLAGDNAFLAESQTAYTEHGLRGSFDMANRPFDWEASVSYSRAKGAVNTFNIRDLEFALALDAVVNPANGQIVCRSQLTPPTAVAGISANLVRIPGPDGIPTEQIFTPTPTADIIAACRPLNPFGFNQMSAEARNYVLGVQKYSNTNEQVYAQASFGTSELFALPGGPFGVNVQAEFRKEEIDFTVDELSRLGRTRTAAIAQTQGESEIFEAGIELRIPIFGEDFSFPVLESFTIDAAARWSQQDGSAPTYRNLQGNLVQQEAKGDTEEIWSIGFNWKPVQDITFRGLKQRSLRQPNIVELFLGGQPAFTTPTDPCSNNQITSGPNPALRRANCENAVVAAGLAADRAAAATFLNTFVAQGAAVQGTFSGSPSLKPEVANSWTAGIVLEPRFAEGLQISSDIIDLDLQNQIFPTNLTQALNFCYDSNAFPNNAGDFGANTCNFFVRAPNFQVTNGFVSGFLNLSATKIRATNTTVDYRFPLAKLLRSENDLGNIRLRAQVYNLREFAESGSGRFDDTVLSNGSQNRPTREAQGYIRYTKGPFEAQWTTNWQDETKVFLGNVFVTPETRTVVEYPSFMTHDMTLAYKFAEKYNVRFTALNVRDKTFLGENGFLDLQYADQLGRRFVLTVQADF